MKIVYCSHVALIHVATLQKWHIEDKTLMYAIPRRKDQPGQKIFATLPKTDYDIGKS